MDGLYKYCPDFFHGFHPSNRSVFDPIGPKQGDGKGAVRVLAGIAAEFPEEGALVAVHAAETHLKGDLCHFASPVPQLQSGLGEPQTPDIPGRRQVRPLDKQPVGVPRGVAGHPGQLPQRNILIQVGPNVVLHTLDRLHLLLHSLTSLQHKFTSFPGETSRLFLL